MENDAFYEYFAPKAEQAGIKKGIEQGIEQGIGIGEQKKEETILRSQREAVCSTVQNRFGSVPVILTQAVDKARSIDSLVDMRVYALTQANSLDDLVSYARNCVF